MNYSIASLSETAAEPVTWCMGVNCFYNPASFEIFSSPLILPTSAVITSLSLYGGGYSRLLNVSYDNCLLRLINRRRTIDDEAVYKKLN